MGFCSLGRGAGGARAKQAFGKDRGDAVGDFGQNLEALAVGGGVLDLIAGSLRAASIMALGCGNVRKFAVARCQAVPGGAEGSSGGLGSPQLRVGGFATKMNAPGPGFNGNGESRCGHAKHTRRCCTTITSPRKRGRRRRGLRRRREANLHNFSRRCPSRCPEASPFCIGTAANPCSRRASGASSRAH